MVFSGGLILWALILYVVLAVLCAVLVLAIAWCGYRMVRGLFRSPQAEPKRPLHPSQVLTPEKARRNYEEYVRGRAGGGLPQRRR
jgi:hypothetical protein